MEVFAAGGRPAVVQPVAETDGFAVEVAVFAEVSVEHTVETEPWLLPPMDLGPHQQCKLVPKLVALVAEAVPHFAEAQPIAPGFAGRSVAKPLEWPDFAVSNASAASPAAAGVDSVVGAAVAVGAAATAEAAGIVVAAVVGQH